MTDDAGDAEPELPLVAVVVLNWNGAGLTSRCVESVLATDYPAHRLRVVVVDNGSIDGSVPLLRRRFPGVEILENGANLGFAEGCNRALRERGEAFAVALVNNDATVDPGWLRPMVARLQADPTAGAVVPKMLLADTFVTVALEHHVPASGGVSGGPSRARVESVTVDGIGALARTLPGAGVVSPPHPSIPLRLEREFATTAELHVPVAALPATVAVVVEAPGEVRAVDGDVRRDGDRWVATFRAAGPGHRRVNHLGTALTPWNEGFERHFGEPDGHFESEEVPGWSGGGVLLRSAYLADVGLFDPAFFAYYEDTDLSWRGRIRGWRTVTEPSAIVHHRHGATAGSSWSGFFLLNYRNWLLTVLRNGTLPDVVATLRTAWRLSWPYARRNVIGRARRLQRPDWQITGRWLRVAAGTLALLAPTLASRRRRSGPRAVGAHRSEVAGPTVRLLGPISPRAPRVEPGAPTVVYVDVTETLRAGWRAGIQRVVTRLVDELAAEPALELVPVVWSPLDRGWRRLGREETAKLLDPPPMHNHPVAAPAPATGIRRVVGPLTRVGPMRLAKEEIRRRRDLRRRDPAVGQLVLDGFEAGSVFFDPDASWNVVEAPRADLLAELAAVGARPVAFVHDVLPITDPDWFDPNLVRVFTEHVVAHLAAGSRFVANSEHTAAELRSVASGRGLPVPEVAVVGLGADHRAGSSLAGELRPELDAAVAARPTVLVVGTIEPRKNHAAVLDAFDRLLADGRDVGLVVVGRLGWRAEAVGERLRTHPELGRRLMWPESVDDAELAALYERCRVVVVPSLTEGYGLPVVEALGFGAAVVASSGGALAEVGGDAVARFEPHSVDQLADSLAKLLFDDTAWRHLRERAAGFRPTTWSECAARVAAVLHG